MSEPHPTAPAETVKPSKPSEDFPLFPHATGRWAKKVKGRMVYFGPWDDPDGAIERYEAFVRGGPLVSNADTRNGTADTRDTSTATADKPSKPYGDFPLFAHATGRWAKKIKGRLHYFGPVADWQAALNKYLDEKDDLHAGRTPRTKTDGLTVRDLLNHFLTHKQRQLDCGEITPRTFSEYKATTDLISQAFGLNRLVLDLRAEDFEGLRANLAKRLGPVALGNTVQRIRTTFNYAADPDVELIDRPVKFGKGFRRPSRKILRKLRNERGIRMFTAEELRKIIGTADRQMKAMVLLGINAGFGNADVGTLPQSALDLAGGWVTYPRPKTHVRRRAKLWPETVEAIKDALAYRPKPKDPADEGLTFVTKYGHRWFTGTPNNPLSHEMAKLLAAAGVEGNGRNFYCLRHGLETVGGASRDQVCVDFVMGHAPDDDDMSAVYRWTTIGLRPSRITSTSGCSRRRRRRRSRLASPRENRVP
jgi:hypothetical protein